MSTLFRYTLVAAGVALLLSGCNGGGPSAAPLGGLTPGKFSTAAMRARFHPHRLWISPNIKEGEPRLLFVTTYGAKTLNVYSMPDMIQRGRVAGFQYPFGECTDGSGQVWVVDNFASIITRFSRNLEITAQLDDNYGFPLSCAVDPTTGTLAVSNIGSPSGAGNVVLYRHASGSGTPVSNPSQYSYYWLGYDRRGTLWVDGEPSVFGGFILSSCRASGCTTIPISGGTIYSPGFVQWAVGTRSWYVADATSCGGNTLPRKFCIYPVSDRGELGKRINLQDGQGRPVCALDQAAITNTASYVLAGGVYGVYYNGDCQYLGAAEVDHWSFPAGGVATHERGDVQTFPYGAAISSR